MYVVTGTEPGQRRLSYPVVSVRDGGHSDWWQSDQPTVSLAELRERTPPTALGSEAILEPLWRHLSDDVTETMYRDGFSPLAWPTTNFERVESFLKGTPAAFARAGRADDALFQEIVGDDPVLILGWREGNATGALTPSYEGFVASVPEGVSNLEVTYTPQRPHELELAYGALRHVTTTPRGQSKGFREMLVWRAYIGENSLFVDGISERRWGSLRHRILLPLARGRRLVVGRIVLAALRRAEDVLEDPTYLPRLDLLERQHDDVAHACPELHKTTSSDSGELIVAVHGTLSCAIPIAAVLREKLPEAKIRRFEHDTFLPVADNATLLSDTILSRPGISRVSFVGHSRGGLVARHAAEQLASAKRNALEVRTMTLGAPFQGSPFINIASRPYILLGAFAWLGARISTDSDVPLLDRLTRTISLLTRLRRLPDGIADMRPGCSFLSSLKLFSRAALQTHAGNYPSDLSQPGYTFLADAQPAFRGEDNDLVVSVGSATVGAGHTTAVSHFGYFKHEIVLKRLTTQLTASGAELQDDLHVSPPLQFRSESPDETSTSPTDS